MNDDLIEIYGGTPLSGRVTVSGAKNGVLPIMLSTLLTKEECTLTNVPTLRDVFLSSDLIRHFGGNVSLTVGTSELSGSIQISVPSLLSSEASYSIVKSLRASFWVLAPLLARGRAARVAMPGGDVIGARPVDIHLKALTEMGADIRVSGGVVTASAINGLKPAEIDFHFPSVGATHQILMAAALTPGKTVIKNAAKEPEVISLGTCLQEMGADLQGLGTDVIEINGVDQLKGFSHAIIGDRIEACTYLFGALASRGEVTVDGFNPDHIPEAVSLLGQMGAEITEIPSGNGLHITMRDRLIQPIEVSTSPFPGFATDNQALLMAALTLADGVSTVTETVYEGRFGHVSELCRMGARIQLSGQTAQVTGVEQLNGATVEARDIRAGAAMIIAGIAASGRTQIEESHHLRRGYERMEEKLRNLGARITAFSEEDIEDTSLGC